MKWYQIKFHSLVNKIRDWWFFKFNINPDGGVWWIKRRTIGEFLDKGGGYIFHDGVVYRIDWWHEILCKAAKLKEDDIIFNPYKGEFTKVKEVKFEWGTINGIEYVCSVIITDDLGYFIFNPEEEKFQ